MEKARLLGVDAPQYLDSQAGHPIDLRFEVVDHRITYRFEKPAGRPHGALPGRLEAFKQRLGNEEPQELVGLLDKSLEGPIRYAFLDASRAFVAEHSELLRKLAE